MRTDANAQVAALVIRPPFCERVPEMRTLCRSVRSDGPRRGSRLDFVAASDEEGVDDDALFVVLLMRR